MKKLHLLLAIGIIPVLMAGCSGEPTKITYTLAASVPNRDPYELTDTFTYSDHIFASLDEKTFSYDLAKIATLSYYESNQVTLKGNGTMESEKGNIFGKLGFKDNDKVSLKANDYDEDKFDLCEYFVGHKEFTYLSKNYQVFAISVLGSKTLGDYISNFDIGIDNPNYMIKDGIHKDWIHKKNHKGYDVTATRTLKKFDTYISEHAVKDATPIVYLCGHSRGAAIVNLMGKEFTDRSIKTFAYSIACPTNTQDENYNNYKNLFVVANRNDVVPFLPPVEFGFNTYGVRYQFEMDKYLDVWKQMCPKFDFIHVNVETFEDAILDIFQNREFAYSLPESYTFGEAQSFDSEEEANEEHDRLENLYEEGTIEYAHTIVSSVEKTLLGDFRFYISSAPAFIFDLISKCMSNLGDIISIVMDGFPFITRYIPEILPVALECIDPEIATKFVLPHVGEGYLVLIKAMEVNDLAK